MLTRAILLVGATTLSAGCARPPGDTGRIDVERAAATLPGAAAAGVPEPPMQSGVLLGFNSLESGLHTLWIVGDGDSAKVVTRGPGLLVPRAAGFWRVERPLDCPFIAAGPADRWPEGAETAGPYGPGPVPELCPNELPENETGVSGGDVGLVSVNRSYLSMRNEGGAYSGRASDSWDDRYVVSLDSIADSWVRLEQALPPAALGRLEAKADPIADSLKRDYYRGDQVPSQPDDPDGLTICRWSLHGSRLSLFHSDGAWRLSAFLGPTLPHCGKELRIEAPDLAPPTLVGRNEVMPAWGVIQAAVPTAEDAVSSPLGDLVIVFTKDSLLGYRITGGTLGRRVLALPYTRQWLVMAEWATGPEVARWTPQIKSFLSDYEAIFGAADWMTSNAFRAWATIAPLEDTVPAPCLEGTMRRLADSIVDVLTCQRIATLRAEGGANQPELAWAIVRSSSSRYDCNAGLSFLEAERARSERWPVDCEFHPPTFDAVPRAAFRVRRTGEVGFVLDGTGPVRLDLGGSAPLCTRRRAILVKRYHLETIHVFDKSCIR